MLCSIIGPEGAGWFAQPIEGMDDFDGLKIRFAGIGGKVLEKLGASVTMVPGGEIYQALERKTIDATEFSQPAIDKMLGLDQIIKNYIMPGWHQTLTTSHLLVNKDTWDKLEPQTRALIEMGCESATLKGFAESEWAQPTALRDYEKEGVTAQTLPEPVLRELQKVTNEVLDEIAAKDEMFKRVLTSQREFMEHHSIWHSKGYLPRDFYQYD
jgi:TRAP-type mannitol/chloroaromatic compound transport system substrate-binding protein